MPQDVSQPDARWVIGRADTCNVVVSDPAVSGVHCRVTQLGNQFLIEDLNSTNGTYVNGSRLTPRNPTPLLTALASKSPAQVLRPMDECPEGDGSDLCADAAENSI